MRLLSYRITAKSDMIFPDRFAGLKENELSLSF